MNTKFVNNLPAYWGKYVTNVKQNMDISTTPYVQIYTHLKAYEPHAKKTLKKQEQSTSIVDPLAYVAHTTSAPALSLPSTPSPQHTTQSPNDALMATMTQIANLLSGFQKQFPPTNTNQLWTSSNSKTHATVHDGHIVTEPRRKMDSQYFKDKALLMEAKEKGDVLDAEAEAFLADVECTAPYDQPQALTTTNMFQANHEDAYDSDVDEGPNAAVAFMANLSSTSATNNPVNENPKAQQLTSQGPPCNPNPGLGLYAKRANGFCMMLIPFCIQLTSRYNGYEEVLVHQVVSKKKMNEKPGHVRPANGFYDKLNALKFVPQQELSREQAYWLPANERASQTSNPNSPVTPFVRKSRPPSQVLTSLRNVNSVFLPHLKKTASREDDTIRNLETQINITRMLNVGSTEGSCDQQALETDRIQSKTHSDSKTEPEESPLGNSANARRVEAHHRTLNKKNRVDSNLLIKHSGSVSNLNNGSVSNLNNVCGACNKSLVFANHTDCLVMCDGSVNVKPHQTKRFKRQPRKEWKPVKRVWKPISKPVANSKPQWKPTGRHFSLFEKYPLTRIMESTDMPIALPPSASSSPQITMISRFTDCKLSDRKAGSKGLS
ncbi:hypothetical protein Tco_0359100, partial [Tanacetum coccineum]